MSFQQDRDSEINHRDITTLLKDGMLRLVERIGKDGKPDLVYEINNKSAWYKTHSINSDRFGLWAEAAEDVSSLVNECKYHMMPERAEYMAMGITDFLEGLYRSIDAKSSETVKNKNTSQTSVLDKYLKNKQERVIDIKGEASKSMMDMFRGKETQRAGQD